jgi:glycosyltransferase involved in cell wall biosynthesis
MVSADMIRVHFTYHHVDRPWGGANNFMRALHEDLSANGHFQFTRSIDEDCDVLFMNQLATGPGGNSERLSLGRVKALVGDSSSAPHRKLVVRAVNLNRHAFALGPRNLTLGWWRDRQTIALLNMADAAIFQSAYQREFFVRAGYRGGNDIIINNGAAEVFWAEQPAHPPLGDTLRFISSTASPRASKRHDLIARLSMVDGVEVSHLGVWPQGIETGRVRLLGMQAREQMIAALSGSHYFLHPAIKDPCPNTVFEAVCAGLPVVYHPGPGSSREIVGACGVPLDESDLAGTVAQARRELGTLRAAVLAQRDRFAISNAAARYRAVFEQVVNGQT